VRAPAGGLSSTNGPLAAVIPFDKIKLSYSKEPPENGAHGRVVRVVFTGVAFLVYVDVVGGSEFKISARAEEIATFDPPLRPEAPVTLAWHPQDVMLVRDDDVPPPVGGTTAA
jgi:hypothetical protein